MLKDPENHSIVRWGSEGDTFVVLEVSLIDGTFRVFCCILTNY